MTKIAKQKERVVVIPWVYEGEIVNENSVPSWAVAMVYKITRIATGKIYIGKKHLTSTNRKKIGMRELANTGTRKRFKTIVKDSGWMTYNSSNIQLKNELLQAEEHGLLHVYHKEILHWCHSKKHASYLEVKEQMINHCLEVDSYVDNVNGKWYRRDLVRKTTEE